MDTDSLIGNLREWQSFAGALIGTTAPISFWFFKERRQLKRKRRQNLYSLEKILVFEINKVISARQNLKGFLDLQLVDLKRGIVRYQAEDKYGLGVTFVPLFFADPIEENLLRLEVESGYLMNKIGEVYATSKDFSLMVNDLRKQFEETIRTNKEIAMAKLNGPEFQNSLFLANIQEFEKMVKQDIFGRHIPSYLRSLVTAHTTASVIRKIGMLRWKLMFSPHFKYFKNKRGLMKFREGTFDRIELYLRDGVNKQVQNIEKSWLPL